MKGKVLPKPPPLLLPPVRLKSTSNSDNSCVQRDGKPFNKFAAKYDTFHGILKRVSDMKLNGSLDSEERSIDSEKSESSGCYSKAGRIRQGCSSVEECSNVSLFEDESSMGSNPEFEHSQPYEEPPNRDAPFASSLNSGRQSVDCERLRDGEPQERFATIKPHDADISANVIQEELFSPDVNYNCTNPLNRCASLEDTENAEGISEVEKHQLEMFFKSLKTEVFVCGTLANLYVGLKEQEGSWTYRHTGVIVVILDSGDTKSRNKRKIQILLAERGTCFPLWKDTIDNLTAYRKSNAAFHTMYLSSDHSQIIGFSFDSPSEAEKLLVHIDQLTSNPENINISVPGSKKKKRPQKKPQPLPHKKQISNPCLFQHVTSVVARDKPMYMSLQTLITTDIMKKEENIP